MFVFVTVRASEQRYQLGLVNDLRQAQNLRPGAAAIDFVSTHASWVFLTEQEVFKVKRPKNYGFLDYSTLEARRHYCEEEVRLNRRTAPGIYLGVVPVYRDQQGFSLTRVGEIVDWAVHMQRLPDDRSALAMVRRGELSRDHLDAIARLLAGFYRAHPRPGGSAPMRRNMEENFVQTRPFAGEVVDPELVAEGELRQRQWLDRNETRLAGRPMVDGHGDLRLEHVYLMPDGPIAIDCIEFTERFRVGDPALDVAFLAMDLIRAGQRRMAEYLLGRIAYELDDYDMWPLVDGYMSYRAWVRGKVACFVASDAATSEQIQARKRKEAASHFQLARDSLGRDPRFPAVIAVGGMIASGKSTLALALSRLHGWPIVSADATRKWLGGIDHEAAGGPELYTPAVTERVQAAILDRARSVLEAGRTVLVDTTCKSRAFRAQLRDVATHFGRFLMIECRAPEDVVRQRLRERPAGVSDARVDLLDSFGRSWEPITELGPDEHVVVDATRPPREIAVQLPC